MFRTLIRILRQLNAYLEEFYSRPPGCCASGGLSVSELNGERKKKKRQVQN